MLEVFIKIRCVISLWIFEHVFADENLFVCDCSLKYWQYVHQILCPFIFIALLKTVALSLLLHCVTYRIVS